MKIVLEQKQMLKMVMTTELRQAIELLQLSTYDLLQFIQDQAEENPLIELIEKVDTNHYNEPRRKVSSGEAFDPLAIATSKEVSLYDYLFEQIITFSLSEDVNAILRYLILNIDARGFLTVNDVEVSEHLQVSLNDVQEARALLRKLEPTGIGARDVKECLLIQAETAYPEDELLYVLIDQHLEIVANKQWRKVSEKLDIPLQKVQKMYDKIQAFNPRPAANFAVETSAYVEPDIMIKYDPEEDTFLITLNDRYIPDLQFNDHYTELGNDKEVSAFVKNSYQKFQWLKNSIEQRRETILKIMNVIVQKQRDFLMDGFRSLHPLTLKEVADEIDMHESTVSRATDNKMIQVPSGTYELKKLFSTKLATNSGGDTSQTQVKLLLQQMIDEEDKYRPLSDQKIADRLKEEKEIAISRRTVAKYRDELKIPSSSRRKKLKV